MNQWIEDPLFVSSIVILKEDIPTKELEALLQNQQVVSQMTPLLAHQEFWRLVAYGYPRLFAQLPPADDIGKLGGMELTFLHAMVTCPQKLLPLKISSELEHEISSRANWIRLIDGDDMMSMGTMYVVDESCIALHAFMEHMSWVGGATDYPFDVCLFRKDYVDELTRTSSEHHLAHIITHELLHCIQGQKAVSPLIGSYDKLPLTIAVIEGCTETLSRYASACLDDASSLEDINPGWLVLGLFDGCYQEQVEALITQPAVADTTAFAKTLYRLGIEAAENASEERTAALLNKYIAGATKSDIDQWKQHFGDVGYDRDA